MKFAATSLFTVVSAFLLAAPASYGPCLLATDPGTGVGSGPKIHFEQRVHDFGAMRSDTPLSHPWEYRNLGDADLEILNVRTNCGCTATVTDKTPVPPGGTGILRVDFDPSGINGTVRKTLAVSSNDPVNARILLTIKATVTLVDEQERSGDGHPPTAGRSMFFGDCATCHAAPAGEKSGEDLYRAVCAMCHGEKGEGAPAPGLRSPGHLAARSAEDLATTISYGAADPHMPGFIDLMGGPLSRQQVDSLVELIRGWEPLDPPDAGGAEGSN